MTNKFDIDNMMVGSSRCPECGRINSVIPGETCQCQYEKEVKWLVDELTEKQNKMTEKLEKRLYILVNRSLSPIQKGIQALHATTEYGIKYPTTEYFEWANEYKTVIVLDGGTSNRSPNFNGKMFNGNPIEYIGDMENHFRYLSKELNINVAQFKEPDINDCLTAIAFIIDERVFNYEKYPEYVLPKDDSWKHPVFGLNYDDAMIRQMNEKENYDIWVRIMGGKQNVELRNFLKQFKLAL